MEECMNKDSIRPRFAGTSSRRRANFKKLEYIHAWMPLLESENTEDGDNVFRESEKLLYRSGLHSKLVFEDGKHVLSVRKSEYEYADALIRGEVSAVYSNAASDYILFKDDFDYKNEKFRQDNAENRRLRINARMSMIYIAIVIIVSMMILIYTGR